MKRALALICASLLTSSALAGPPSVSNGSAFNAASPPPIGNTTPNTGAFTTLTAKQVLATGGTATTNAPPLLLTQTWNGSAVVFRGLDVQITDTLSSLMSGGINLDMDGATYFRVGKGAASTATIWLLPSGGAPATNNELVKVSGLITTMSTLSGGELRLGESGAPYVDFVAPAGAFSMRMVAGGLIGFVSTNSFTGGGGTLDTMLSRKAAATLQLGAGDAAAPVAQGLSVQSVVTGTTNTGGANFTVSGSASTGTGAGGSIILQVTPAGTTSSTVNAYQAALTVTPLLQTQIAGDLRSVVSTFAPIPTVASCGTGPTIAGTDTAMRVTAGTTATTCTITFGRAKLVTPACTIGYQPGGSGPAYTVSTTGIAITYPGTVSTVITNIICVQQ